MPSLQPCRILVYVRWSENDKQSFRSSGRRMDELQANETHALPDGAVRSLPLGYYKEQRSVY